MSFLYNILTKNLVTTRKAFQSKRSQILVMMRVILGSAKVVGGGLR